MAKRTAKANGKYARAKGIRFELEIVNLMKEFYPDANRLLECQEGFGFDIANTGEYRIQCKNYANYAPINKIEEAPNDEHTIPLLVTKGNRKPTVVCMYLEDFLKMERELQALRLL